MKQEQLLEQIREANLNYLLLAQHLIRQDRDAAVYRLGVDEELADLIDKLTPAQLMRIAASNTLLCRFRFDDRVILDLLVAKGEKSAISSAHAAILMAQQPAEALA